MKLCDLVSLALSLCFRALSGVSLPACRSVQVLHEHWPPTYFRVFVRYRREWLYLAWEVRLCELRPLHLRLGQGSRMNLKHHLRSPVK